MSNLPLSELGPLQTFVVWILRLSIPVVLLWTYHKFQTPKPTSSSHPQKCIYSRSLLLRNKPQVAARPPGLAFPKVIHEDQAPRIYAKGRRNRKKSRAEEKEEPTEEKTDDKKQLEYLLNYVAFNRKDRAYHPDCALPSSPTKETQRISTENMERANLEAQIVLKAAVNFNRGGIAKDLWTQLSDANIEVEEKTFTLLIEACVHANDLKSAIDLIMKMEASGFVPESKLLDKVMDLYSVDKLHRKMEAEKENREEDQPRTFLESMSEKHSDSPLKLAQMLRPELKVATPEEVIWTYSEQEEHTSYTNKTPCCKIFLEDNLDHALTSSGKDEYITPTNGYEKYSVASNTPQTPNSSKLSRHAPVFSPMSQYYMPPYRFPDGYPPPPPGYFSGYPMPPPPPPGPPSSHF